MDQSEPEHSVLAEGHTASEVKSTSGFKPFAFVQTSWAELQRVQWPTRQQVGQATMIVIVFVVVVGLFLGLADSFARKIVDLII